MSKKGKSKKGNSELPPGMELPPMEGMEGMDGDFENQNMDDIELDEDDYAALGIEPPKKGKSKAKEAPAVIDPASLNLDEEGNIDDISLDEDELKAMGMDINDLDEDEKKMMQAKEKKKAPEKKPEAKKPAPKAKPKPEPEPEEDGDDEGDEEAPVEVEMNDEDEALLKEVVECEINELPDDNDNKETKIKLDKKDAKHSGSKEKFHKKDVAQITNYEDYFNFFAANVLNYIEFADDKENCQEYLERIKHMTPFVVQGKRAKFPPINAYKTPKPVPPFAMWNKISSGNPINIPPEFDIEKSPTDVLDKDFKELMRIATELKTRKQPKSALTVARAAKQVKDSIHKLTEPCFLTTDLITWEYPAENMNISAKEIAIHVINVTTTLKNYRLGFKIPGFTKELYVNASNVGETLNFAGLKPATSAKKFQSEQGILSLESDPSGKSKPVGQAHFSLVELNSDIKTQHKIAVAGSTVEFEILVNKPLVKEKIVIDSYEYHMSPLLVGQDLNIKAQPPKQDQPAAEPPKQAAKPAAKPASKPAAKQPAKPQIQIPEVRIMSDEELSLFWPGPVLERFQEIATEIVKYCKSHKMPVQPGLEDQARKVGEKIQEMTAKQESGELTLEIYKEEVKKAIEREKARIPTLEEKFREEHKAFVFMMVEHSKELEEM